MAIDAFHKAMLDGHNKYTTTAGLPALREKIARSWDSYQSGMTKIMFVLQCQVQMHC